MLKNIVSITVYNIRGEVVRTLDERDIPKGWNKFRWDGTDRFGSQTANGLYFVTISGNDFHACKRIVKFGAFAPASNRIENASSAPRPGSFLGKGLAAFEAQYKVTITGTNLITFIDSVTVSERQREHNFTDVDRIAKFVQGGMDSLYAIFSAKSDRNQEWNNSGSTLCYYVGDEKG